MELDNITTSPQVEDFTPLSQHQEQTPASFFDAKAVLHLHSPAASLKISPADLESQPALADLQDTTRSTDNDGDVLIPNIDVWVTSTHLILFSPAKSTGARIPYPTITVHAQDGAAVFLGLNLSDNNTPDEDLVFIQSRIIPTTIAPLEPQAQQDAEQSPQTNGHTPPSPSQALFKAISDCQELNPDPPQDGDDEDGEGGFDETAPGATGWITSENMADFMDENGEFRMPEGGVVYGGAESEGLGEGAGRTRTADEVDGEDAQDETKWQRTG